MTSIHGTEMDTISLITDPKYEHVSVKFTVKPQVLTQQKRPCVIYQEIRFAEAVNIEFITFRNFYCAFVTIHRLKDKHAATRGDEWVTILSKYQLMKNGHYENDAQNSHIIHHSQFIINTEKENTTSINSKQVSEKTSALRFYLIQPSSNWTSFGLRDLMCYTLTAKKKEIALKSDSSDLDDITDTVSEEQTANGGLDIHQAALLFRQLANETGK